MRQFLRVSDVPIITKNNLSYLKYERGKNVGLNSGKSSNEPSSNVLIYVVTPSYTV